MSSVPTGKRAFAFAALATTFLVPALLQAQTRGNPRPDEAAAPFLTAVPDHVLDVVLSRPTDQAITFSLLAYTPQSVSLRWTTSDGTEGRASDVRLRPGEPQSVDLNGLQRDREYRYEVSGADGLLASGRFHTQRDRDAPFVFTVTADSHLDAGTRADVYERTLQNIVTDSPDLHFDLGDTFMTEKHAVYEDARAQYLAQRYWFGLLAATSPLFLALGNHDGELGYVPRAGQQGMPPWAASMRTRYFPNPQPNAFYSGSPMALPGVPALQNYYAFEWGDALFAVLDPFWPTQQRSGRTGSGWDITLGGEQYRWLENTLARSTARFKFVFVHHLVGGSGNEHRGGIEFVPLFEWGGTGTDGRDEFRAQRPSWSMPIHALLAKYGVNVVFHGHDHLFAHQELDGITYQAVPQPSHPEQRVQNLARAYGYAAGDILPSPGHLRVRVGGDAVDVDYVRSFLPAEARAGRMNGRVDLSYRLEAR